MKFVKKLKLEEPGCRINFYLVIGFLLCLIGYETILIHNFLIANLVRLLTLVVLGVCVVCFFVSAPKSRVTIGSDYKILSVFSVYVIITSFFYDNHSFLNILDILKIFCLGLSIRVFFMNNRGLEKDIERFSLLIVILLSLAAFLSLLLTYKPIVEILPRELPLGFYQGRLHGIRGNPNGDSIYAFICLFVIVGIYNFKRLGRFEQIGLFLCALINILVLVFSASRSALLSLSVLSLFPLWMVLRRKNFFLNLAFFAIFGLVIFLAFSPIRTSIVGLVQKSSGNINGALQGKAEGVREAKLDGDRLIIWRECSKLPFHYPLGVGNRMMNSKCKEISPLFNRHENDMHNFVLRLFVSYGFLGGVLGMLFMGSVFLIAIKNGLRLLGSGQFDLCMFLILFMISTAVRGLFDTDFFPSFTLLVFMFFMAYEGTRWLSKEAIKNV